MSINKISAIYGKLATVYHGSHTPPNQFIDIWKSGDFKPGLGAGQMHGPGLYTVFERGHNKTFKGDYGPYIYKFAVNLDGYLILTEKQIDIIYPELRGLSYINKLQKQCEWFGIDKIYIYGITEEPKYTSDIINRIQHDGLHSGVVFFGRNDGPVCIVQIPTSARLLGCIEEKWSESAGKNIVEESKFDFSKVNKAKTEILTMRENKADYFRQLSALYPNLAIEQISALNEAGRNVERFKHILSENIYNYAKSEPFQFLNNSVLELFPEAGEIAAEEVYKKGKYFEFLNHNLEQKYPEIGDKVAKEVAGKKPEYFFKFGLHNSFAQYARFAAENIAETNPIDFFTFKVAEQFPELEKNAAENLSKSHPTAFFDLKLQNKYKDISLNLLRKLESSVDLLSFFEFFNRKNILSIDPIFTKNIISKITEKYPRLYFMYNFNEQFPEMEISAAKMLIDEDPYLFFRYKLDDKYKDLVNDGLKSLLSLGPDLFFNLNLQNKYPDYERELAEKIAIDDDRTFFNYGLNKKYPDIEKWLAAELSKGDAEYFFYLRLDEGYPQFAETALKRLSEQNWAKFFTLNLDDKYPNFGEFFASKILNEPNGLFWFKKLKLDSKYPNLTSDKQDSIEKLSSWLIKNGFRKEFLYILDIMQKE